MVGAGAVGGYFGARMLASGLDVAFLLRHASARALRETGLDVRSPLGDVYHPKPEVLEPDGRSGPVDVVFFACRAGQVEAAAELARPFVSRRTIAVPLQNGVGAPSVLSRVLGAGSVIGGLSRIFAERVAVGQIVHMTLTPSITIGEVQGGLSDRVERVVATLEPVFGMEVDASVDIWTAMWIKLLLVCTMGSVGAASRAPIGVLLRVPQTRRLLEAVGDEIAAVARSTGARIPEGLAGEQIPKYSGLPAETTASMHRDLERGDPSELREQLGEICALGDGNGVATPTLDTLYGVLLPGELRARGTLAYQGVAARGAGREPPQRIIP